MKFHPVGKTDSERLLCALLAVLSEKGISFTNFQCIEAVLRKFNGSGTMNLLFSEGEHLYSYRDQGGYKGLCVTQRAVPFARVSLRDEDWEVAWLRRSTPNREVL